MNPAVASPAQTRSPWTSVAWFAVLVGVCYAPVLAALAYGWVNDADMGHGFFVPIVAGYIIWQRREELLAIEPKPNLLGLGVVLLGGCQLIAATLGVELFLARTAFVITVIGAVWLLRGTQPTRMGFPR